jgi:hypothetical protein
VGDTVSTCAMDASGEGVGMVGRVIGTSCGALSTIDRRWRSDIELDSIISIISSHMVQQVK